MTPSNSRAPSAKKLLVFLKRFSPPSVPLRFFHPLTLHLLPRPPCFSLTTLILCPFLFFFSPTLLSPVFFLWCPFFIIILSFVHSSHTSAFLRWFVSLCHLHLHSHCLVSTSLNFLFYNRVNLCFEFVYVKRASIAVVYLSVSVRRHPSKLSHTLQTQKRLQGL